MISKSLIQMTKGRWREFKREPSALFFVVFMPVVWMVILGLAFSGDKKETFGIGYLTTDKTSSDKISKFLEETKSVKLFKGNEQEQVHYMKAGKTVLLVKFDTKLDQLIYRFDPNNPQSVRARQITDDKIQRHFGRADIFKTTDKKIEIAGTRYIDFLIPGLLALSILTSSLFGTGMTIVVNRRENLLKRYLTTPMNSYEYIISHIFGRYFIWAVEFFTVWLVSTLLFDFNIQGSFLAYTFLSILGTAAFTAMAIFFGAKTSNSSTYNGMTNLITVPMMMLSGIWFSRTGFPDWLSAIIDYLPLTALVDGLRKIALEGLELTQIIPEISILCAYTVVATVLAKMRFKWY